MFMVKKDQFTLLFVPYFEFRGTNYIRNLFRFCVQTDHAAFCEKTIDFWLPFSEELLYNSKNTDEIRIVAFGWRRRTGKENYGLL